MARIIIEVSDGSLYAEACRYVADQLDMGNTNGIIGMSEDEFWIEED